MSKKKRRRLPVFLAALVLLLFACDARLRVVHYEVITNEAAAPVRLSVITDLHSCAYGEGQQTLLEAVEAQSPDIVLLVGDIVDDVLPEENAWVTIQALVKQWPCFYVTGNHEWWTRDAERICAEMEAYGVTVLRGEGAEVEVEGQTLALWGIDDPDSGKSEAQLEEAGAQVSGEGIHILLAHRPERIQNYLKYPFDLIVSGHAHGGQWRLPGLINGLFAPNQGLFPEYAGGRYDFEDAVFLVSRGLARETTKLPRIFNRPELLTVDILPQS